MGTFNPKTGKETFTGWGTPQGLFDFLDSIYCFKVDAAADEGNKKMTPWFGPGGEVEDALSLPKWPSPAWCNPPYGKGIDKWLDHFALQRSSGGVVVALMPARTESQWWKKGIVPFCDIIFLTGRVPFVGPHQGEKSQPDHPSAICIYSPLSGGSAKWWDWRKDVG